MSGPPSLLPIVEGQSEIQGFRVLLRRLLTEVGRPEVLIEEPFRISRTKVLRGGEIARALKLGLQTRSNVGAILVLIDADDDAAETLRQAVLTDCRQATHIPAAAVVARREFEAWFLGAKESLRGKRGIKPDANSPAEPESIRDAKGRLTSNMERGRSYLPVDDQPAFAAVFDLDAARARCPSFQLLCDELRRLVAGISVT